MLKSIVIAAALVAATASAYACDGFLEAAVFTQYDKHCKSLPADFIAMIRKEYAGGGNVREMLKNAQDSEQASYEADPKGYCQSQADFVKRAISAYRRHGTRYCF